MPAVKRQKLEGEASSLQSRIFEEDYQSNLQKDISESEPYKFGVIHGLLNDDLLKKARSEILDKLAFTTKETDIYKVNQTGDLRNMDGLDPEELKELESLGKVREALYSPEFRELMSRVTQCGPLSGKRQDLSVNLYNKGCHLLNHDDVIGTRRVSYILYLLPPDEPWDPKWGGALRLFPTVKAGVPAPDWTVSVPPEWNQLSFFRIQPGHSFHDVEEVFVDKPRLSISGWFHIPMEDEPGYTPESDSSSDADKATLAQIQSNIDGEGFLPHKNFEPVVPAAEIDKAYLGKYIAQDVLEDTKALRETFENDSMINISSFLAPDFLKKVHSVATAQDLEPVPQTSHDVSAPWSVARPPHIRRYMYLSGESDDAFSQLKELFRSPQFARFLEEVTGLKPTMEWVEGRRFRPGQDFTLAQTSGREDPILELVLDVTPAKWDNDAGGYDLVMAGDDEDDDPAVYRNDEDDDGVLLSSFPTGNSFNLILRDPELLRFVKYVSRSARGSRWDVTGQYLIEN